MISFSEHTPIIVGERYRFQQGLSFENRFRVGEQLENSGSESRQAEGLFAMVPTLSVTHGRKRYDKNDSILPGFLINTVAQATHN